MEGSLHQDILCSAGQVVREPRGSTPVQTGWGCLGVITTTVKFTAAAPAESAAHLALFALCRLPTTATSSSWQ